MPDTFSSMCPLRAPSTACCSLNSTRVRREMVRDSANTSGTVTSPASASGGLNRNIMASEPPMMMTVDMSWVVDWEMVTETLSMSLASRLIRSPWSWVSKYATGSRCSLAKSEPRRPETICWDTPAISHPWAMVRPVSIR